jgi:diaminopimelate epimerase
MQFSKWHALGNAYLVVERADAGELSPERVRRLCDVDIGIGADGVLEVVGVAGSSTEVVIWNPDGSVAEMSGNGTRIVAAWLAARASSDAVTIETSGRVVTARIREDGLIEQSLGEVSVGPLESIDVHGNAVELVTVDVGNPHAVVPTVDPARETLLRLGPLVETHHRFPARTNVQLAHADGRHDVRALVWERGAGETASSGSSAVAVAAAAIALDWCENPVTVHFPGGDLSVTLTEAGATLVGPAEEICRGEALL